MVVGTRSAVFAPVTDLALVIVDEEQDPSYKQEETPRYHARDVAVMRAKMANAAVVLGSATPSLESYFNAKKGKYRLLELPDRVEQREQIGLGRRAVLEVEHDPVEAGLSAQLRGEGRGEVGEDADERLPGADAGSKVGHAPMMPCPMGASQAVRSRSPARSC